MRWVVNSEFTHGAQYSTVDVLPPLLSVALVVTSGGGPPPSVPTTGICDDTHMSDRVATPTLRQVVLDGEDARALAEFYRQLLGLRYRRGDEPPGSGAPSADERDWLVLTDSSGVPQLAFQQIPDLPPATWPDGPRPQMLHLDTTVPTLEDLHRQHRRALDLGARLLHDRSQDAEEPLMVYADPAGHPFCIFVA
jgi:catechol 2,3-dioxygenase-like lactoylglutathione lyase family enzyme